MGHTVVLAVLSALSVMVAMATTMPPSMPPTSRPCQTPFGTIIGTALGVPAYSNCNDYYTSDASNYYRARTGNGSNAVVYTGMQWQCVEYGRRTLFLHLGLVFGDVVGASNIWAETTLHSPLTKNVVAPLQKWPNGAKNATKLPSPGCLLIYPVQPRDMPFGHVAVVSHVEVSRGGRVGQVFIGEQNWESTKWKHANYSRALKAVVTPTGGWRIIDDEDYIMDGWMCAA